MSPIAATQPKAPALSGAFNYLAASVEPSLHRNGKVLTRRDRDGGDAGTVGMELERHPMRVEDARRLEGNEHCTLASHGFELLERPLLEPGLDFLELAPVVEHYYDECAEIVRAATGATQVFAFDHNVRSLAGNEARQRIAGGQEVQAPARVVHGDYTLTSAPQRLRDLTQAPSRNDTYRTRLAEDETLLHSETVERTLRGGRFALINVWRNIAHEPVVSHPLALCDARSVDPRDLVVFEIHYHDRVGENYFAKHAQRHRWYLYPQLTRDEALLIKQWDSAGPLARSKGAAADASDPDSPCSFSFHSAFSDPATPDDAPNRWSIEVRCVALYE